MNRERASEVAFDFDFEERLTRTWLEFDWTRRIGDLRLDLIVPRGGFARDNTATFTLVLNHEAMEEISIVKTADAEVLCRVLEGMTKALEAAAPAPAPKGKRGRK